MYNHFSLKRFILAVFLCSSLSILAVQAAEPASLAGQAHREVHTTVVTQEEWHSSTRESASHSGWSVSRPSSLGDVVFPAMARHLPPPGMEKISSQVKAEYDANYKDGVLAAVKDGTDKWGLMGTDGKWLMAPAYKSLSYAGKGVFMTEGKRGTAYVDKQGAPAVWPEKEAASAHFFKDQGRYGIQDKNGNIVVAPTYKAVLADFSEGLAFVKDNKGEKVAIDEKGRVQFAAPYDVILPYHHGLAEYQRRVSHFNLGGFLAGALIGSSTHSVYYDDEVAPLTYDGVKRGYLDRVGNIVIDSKNDAVYPMTEFGTFVRNKGKLGFVNRKGQYLIAPGNYSLDDGRLLDDVDGFVSLKDKENGKWGVFSMVDGAQVIDFAYDGVQFLGAQRLLLTKGDKNMLINQETGAFVAEFPAKVKWLAFLLEDYTWCWNDKKEYAIVDRNGQVQYRAAAGQIQDVKSFRNGLTPVKTKTGWGIMDHQGQWIVEPQYKDITMV